MLYRTLADVVLVLHLGFVGFVVLGGLLVVKRPRWAWAHVPAAVWGVIVEYTGWICPLTPLELALRERGGSAGYPGGFLEHYVTAVLYPVGLTRGWQIALGSLALGFNVVVYWLATHQRSRSDVGPRSTSERFQ